MQADAVTADLDQPRPAAEWTKILEELTPAAALGRDQALAERVKIAEARFAEARAYESFERYRGGASPEEIVRLADAFLSGVPSGPNRAKVLEVHAAAQEAVETNQWEAAQREAEAAKAGGDYSAALARLNRLATEHQGRPREQDALALINRWAEADWAQAMARVAALEQQDRQAEAAAECEKFLALPHRGGAQRSEAERLALRLKSEDTSAFSAYLRDGLTFRDGAQAGLWQMGVRAFKSGDPTTAIACWAQLAGDAAHGEAIGTCLRAALLHRMRELESASAAGRAIQSQVQEFLKACDQVAKALGRWERLGPIRQWAADEDIPDESRDSYRAAEKLSADASASTDVVWDALALYERARAGLEPNPSWKARLEDRVARARGRFVQATLAEMLDLTKDENWRRSGPSTRRVRESVRRALSVDAGNDVLQRLLSSVETAPVFPAVKAWADLQPLLQSRPLALSHLETLVVYRERFPSHPFPDEWATALTAVEEAAWKELSGTHGDLETRLANAERRAPLFSTARWKPQVSQYLAGLRDQRAELGRIRRMAEDLAAEGDRAMQEQHPAMAADKYGKASAAILAYREKADKLEEWTDSLVRRINDNLAKCEPYLVRSQIRIETKSIGGVWASYGVPYSSHEIGFRPSGNENGDLDVGSLILYASDQSEGVRDVGVVHPEFVRTSNVMDNRKVEFITMDFHYRRVWHEIRGNRVSSPYESDVKVEFSKTVRLRLARGQLRIIMVTPDEANQDFKFDSRCEELPLERGPGEVR